MLFSDSFKFLLLKVQGSVCNSGPLTMFPMVSSADDMLIFLYEANVILDRPTEATRLGLLKKSGADRCFILFLD